MKLQKSQCVKNFSHVKKIEGVFPHVQVSYTVENSDECLLGWPQAIRQCPRKMDEIIMARCLSTVGEPRSEILHAPHLFLVGRFVNSCFLLQGKDLKFELAITL